MPRIPEAIQAELDLPYAATDNPLAAARPLPTQVAQERETLAAGGLHPRRGFHDGRQASWAGGRRPERLEPGSTVASGEYAGASIGYRLSQEAIWPAQIHDCKAAIRWLRANSKKYGLDLDRIGIMGTSAGGHLAAIIGTSGGVAALEGHLGEHLDVSSRATCVVNQFGPTDFLALYGGNNHAPDVPEAKLIGGPLADNPEAAKSASPITYVAANNPPFLIIHGTSDPAVNFKQSERFFSALQKAGVDATFVRVVGGGHGNFPTPEVPQRIRAFFDKHLRGTDVAVSAEPIKLEQQMPGRREGARS